MDHVDTIYTRDIRGHTTRILARARKGWRTDWVKVDRAWVVYMEAASEATEDDPSPAWHMYLLNLSKGSRKIIASSSAAHGGVPPSPQIDADRLIWAQGSAAGPGRYDLLSIALTGDGVPKRLVTGGVMTDYGITSGRVVYISRQGPMRDLFVVPAAGDAAPERLTSSGRVLRANVAEGVVAYEEGPIGSDPQEQFVIAVEPGAKPTRITGPAAPGTVPDSNVTPGRNLISWFDAQGGSAVARNGSPRVLRLTSTPDVQLRFDWDGDRLLWGETTVEQGHIRNVLSVSEFS